MLGQNTEKSNQRWTKIILQTGLKFQFVHACLLREDASTNFGGKVDKEEEERIEHPQ